MSQLRITPFSDVDDAAACALERACVQGGTLALRFRRPSFQARSRVYRDASILCGWVGDHLVGTVAAARKRVRLNGTWRTAVYFYGLRVHPAHRGRGFANRLIEAIIEHAAADADCLYVLVAGQNAPMRGLLRTYHRFDREYACSLTYACLPVFRSRPTTAYELADPADVRRRHLAEAPCTLVPAYEPSGFLGHVESVRVEGAGCSVWTNEQLMVEEVVRLPAALTMLGATARVLRPFAMLPTVPKPGEAVKSWFVYDLYAESAEALGRLLRVVNNRALARGRSVLYLLRPSDDGVLTWVRRHQRVRFSFPYRFLLRGREVPAEEARVYLDVRDL